MARYSFARKEFERGRTYAGRVELSRPANSELRGLLGSIYEALGKTQDAMREYESAVRLAPSRADFQDALRTIRSREAQCTPVVTKACASLTSLRPSSRGVFPGHHKRAHWRWT